MTCALAVLSVWCGVEESTEEKGNSSDANITEKVGR